MTPESPSPQAAPSEAPPTPPESAPSRASKRRRWRDAIVSGEMTDIASAFERDGVTRPEVVWMPGIEDCTVPQTSFLLAHWRKLADGPSVPDVGSIDPIGFAPALGFVHLVEPLSCGEDFVYRIFATSIAGISGGDFSGRRMSELRASDYVVDFGIACCGAVCDAKKPLVTRRRPARANVTAYWERVLLPFAGPDGGVERLLIGVAPVSDAGTVILPRAGL